MSTQERDLNAYIKALVAVAPPLTKEQHDKLALLLRTPTQGETK